MFIDTHAHLYAQEFDQDRLDMIDRALSAGIGRIYLPNVDLDTIELMHAVCTYSDRLYPMLGLHPCHVGKNYTQVLDQMYDMFHQSTYYGIGETGIDLHWDTSTIDLQIEAFKVQCAWAAEFNLPIIIHSRAATEVVIDTLEQMSSRPARGIFHCFGGTKKDIDRIDLLGDYCFGIGGVVTFKNSGLAELMPYIPPGKIVLETDAPYLAPAPYRGKRNEPSYLTFVAQKLAETLGMSVEQLSMLTTDNARRVFYSDLDR